MANPEQHVSDFCDWLDQLVPFDLLDEEEELFDAYDQIALAAKAAGDVVAVDDFNVTLSQEVTLSDVQTEHIVTPAIPKQLEILDPFRVQYKTPLKRSQSVPDFRAAYRGIQPRNTRRAPPVRFERKLKGKAKPRGLTTLKQIQRRFLSMRITTIRKQVVEAAALKLASSATRPTIPRRQGGIATEMEQIIGILRSPNHVRGDVEPIDELYRKLEADQLQKDKRHDRLLAEREFRKQWRRIVATHTHYRYVWYSGKPRIVRPPLVDWYAINILASPRYFTWQSSFLQSVGIKAGSRWFVPAWKIVQLMAKSTAILADALFIPFGVYYTAYRLIRGIGWG